MSDSWPLPGQKSHEADRENADSSEDLESLRSEIDNIDSQLAVLLARRFLLTEKIGKTKSRLGLNVRDEAREQKVLEKVSKNLASSSSRSFILRIFESLMKESVEHQKTVIAKDD